MCAFSTISNSGIWDENTGWNNIPNLKGTSKTVALVDGADYKAPGTNDHVTINAAITAVNAAGGGIVYVKKGTYEIGSCIQMLDNVWLVGEGWGTILKCKGGTTLTGVVRANGEIQNFAIVNIAIDGNDTGGGITPGLAIGTNTNGSHEFLVQDVKIIDCENQGMLIKQSYHGKISNNIVDGTDGSSIAFQSACNKITCEDNILLNPDAHGIGVSGSAGACNRILITGNYVYNTGADGGTPAIGITVDGGSYRIVVSNNIVDTTVYAGINFENGPYDCLADSNIVISSGAGYNGIGVPGDTAICRDIIISGNLVLLSGKDGIHSHGTNGLENYNIYVTGNIVRASVGHGIRFNYTDHSIISGNISIENDSANSATYDGINIANSDYNMIIGNRCNENDGHEINIASGIQNEVEDNLLKDTNHEGCFNDGARAS